MTHDVAEGEDVRHVGTHLDVDVDEATVCDGHAGFVGCDLLSVGCAAYGLQSRVTQLHAHQIKSLDRASRRAALVERAPDRMMQDMLMCLRSVLED